ncbi:hypothetical protein LI90_1260 [Carbonactinospora thermoautotrophica]|uniref:Uncharacterized protein n=1 Tax=Carbonactinospora thermoautotrophica TaxID=1469144 RepID=A0A132MP26_9ACTN|nr:hypothetical protein LI90_1260 [Carbonactinospora thermoautotrophica]
MKADQGGAACPGAVYRWGGLAPPGLLEKFGKTVWPAKTAP